MCNIMLRPGDYKLNSKCGYLGHIEKPVTVASNALHRDDVNSCDVYAFNPNDWGLYCMIGNAAEMVWEWSPGMEWKNRHAKAKGGSWRDHEDEVGIHMKRELEYRDEKEASPFIGFRPVMTFVK